MQRQRTRRLFFLQRLNNQCGDGGLLTNLPLWGLHGWRFFLGAWVSAGENSTMLDGDGHSYLGRYMSISSTLDRGNRNVGR